jgi:hypothetical protein
MGEIMEEKLLTVLFIGGFIGWTLFAFTFGKLYFDRKKEIEMIVHLQDELKIVQHEIKNLK